MKTCRLRDCTCFNMGSLQPKLTILNPLSNLPNIPSLLTNCLLGMNSSTPDTAIHMEGADSGEICTNRSRFMKWKGERGKQDIFSYPSIILTSLNHWAYIKYLTKMLKPYLWPQVATPKSAGHGMAIWGWFQKQVNPHRVQVTVPSFTAETFVFL